MSAESIGQTAFLGVAWPRDAKPTHPGAAGGTVDQKNWAKTLPREAGWSICGVEIGEAKRKFRVYKLRRESAHQKIGMKSDNKCARIHAGKLTMSLIEALRPLRRVAWLRSGVYLAIILKRQVLADPWTSPAAFEQKYASGPDSWGYETPAGDERLARAAQLLDTVAKGRRLRCALEIGCGEGVFTQLLAERCEELLAVDFAPTALARAAARRNWNSRVRFQRLDLMREQLSGSFDLITLMDVLDYFSTHGMKAACEKVLACLPPGGYLLMTGVKQADVFDTAWWSKWIIWGGQRIKRHLAEHPLLKPVGRGRNGHSRAGDL